MSATTDLLDQARLGRRPVPQDRVGVDRFTGAILVGEDHERQCVETLLTTRFHELLSRRWVGSFLPHMIGQSATARSLLRITWATATSIDLFEPNWTVKRITIPPAQNPNDRTGRGVITMQIAYERSPRAHLGDKRGSEHTTSSITYGGLPV